MCKRLSFLCTLICVLFPFQSVQAKGNPVNYIAKLEYGTRQSDYPPEVVASKLGVKYKPDAVAVVVVTKVDFPDSIDILVNKAGKLSENVVANDYSADDAILLLRTMGYTLKSDPSYKRAPQKGRMINAPYILVYKARKERDEPSYTVITHSTEGDMSHQRPIGQVIQVFFISKEDINGQPADGTHAETLQRVKYKTGMDFLSLKSALQHSSLVHQIASGLTLDNPGLKA